MTTLTHKATVQIPADVEATVKNRVGQLSMLPAIASEALEVTKDPNCSMNVFSAVVERDAGLATDILAMANSVMSSPGRPILRLSEAVVRLGFQQCRNLIYTSSMASLMNKISLEEEWIREALCRHGFVTALLSMRLNQALNLGFQGEEFTVGLMHDFGRTLLSVAFPQKFAAADPLSFTEDGSGLLRREKMLLGADHSLLGAWFAERNGLPNTVVEAIRLHHIPERAVLNAKLSALTAVSDHVANHIQRDQPASAYDPSANWGLAALQESAPNGAAGKLADVVIPLIERVIAESNELMDF
jgi:HD-like signal output (HDOD) protein